jgi:hypothetical protein
MNVEFYLGDLYLGSDSMVLVPDVIIIDNKEYKIIKKVFNSDNYIYIFYLEES